MKVKIAEARRRDMCERFRESGLTRKAFCEANGIGVSTLGLWLQKESRVKKPIGKMVSIGTVCASEFRRALRVRVRDGIVIELDMPATEGEIESVIRAVAGL